MPRLPIDYSKSVIYKICCKDLNIKDVYIGSTTDFLKRKTRHKTNVNIEKNKHKNVKLYNFIRNNGGWNNWDMVLVKEYPCSNSLKLHKKERKYIEKYNATLNEIIPFRSEEEKKELSRIRTEKHRNNMTKEDKLNLKIYKQQHYLKNIDKIKQERQQIYTCVCGSSYKGKNKKSRHEKTLKHQNFILNN